MGLTLKPKELIKFLEKSGYKFVRTRGTSHKIYSNGSHSVSIPIHGGKEFNIEFIMTILQETDLSKKKLLKYLNR
ncbi:MAG: type II toxin-antitoxin system HicA family toxin [Candidatus Cloacimonetes bacterium]|nr:type II toxin-antitoxin system HicA family toxin [Candidatus Cloacimonadota bacterium]